MTDELIYMLGIYYQFDKIKELNHEQLTKKIDDSE